MSDLSWLNPTPHAIAVYASQPLSPVATQHSLPSGRYSLLGPDFHRQDRASFAWRTHSITSSARASGVGGTSRPSASHDTLTATEWQGRHRRDCAPGFYAGTSGPGIFRKGLNRRLHRQISRLPAFEDAVEIAGGGQKSSVVWKYEGP